MCKKTPDDNKNKFMELIKKAKMSSFYKKEYICNNKN